MEQLNDGVPGTESVQPAEKKATNIKITASTISFSIKLCQYSTCRACSGTVSPFEERLQRRKNVMKWSQTLITFELALCILLQNIAYTLIALLCAKTVLNVKEMKIE